MQEYDNIHQHIFYKLHYYPLDQDEKRYYTWSDDGSTVAVTKRVAKELGVDYHTLDGKEVFDQADNNEVYKKYVDEYYRTLAMGIYNLQYAYDPSMIIIVELFHQEVFY